MYLHIGQNVVVPTGSVVGVFDLDNTTSTPVTRRFLERLEAAGRLFNIAEDIPRSFVVCREAGVTTVYLSQLSSQTLARRAEQPAALG